MDMTDTTDGWVPWTGGPCPIPNAKGGEFEIQHRGFVGGKPQDRNADTFIWHHDGSYSDIIAYRINIPKPTILEQLIALGGEAQWVPVEYRNGFQGLAMVRPNASAGVSKPIISSTPCLVSTVTKDGMHHSDNGTSELDIVRVIGPRRSEWGYAAREDGGGLMVEGTWDDKDAAIKAAISDSLSIDQLFEFISEGDTTVETKLHPVKP